MLNERRQRQGHRGRGQAQSQRWGQLEEQQKRLGLPLLSSNWTKEFAAVKISETGRPGPDLFDFKSKGYAAT